ncbi:HSP20-like chaperone [Dactylonectria estremocensis]|uniref:HSP20-like chaperone n=1 Tax=Dactylonectria estremocensis TaxID=1079267 RepID=A0A9P9EG27_9HYPO|nr:HSP20-like chaperone [Dactylonectria estremocensis]
MAFVPFKLSNSDASFSPLFRLLDEFNTHYSPEGPGRRTALPTWQPNFDIRETQHAFELHGEFPGMKKEDVHIKFTEPQTMLIHGKTERSYTSNEPAAPAAGLIENTSVDAAAKDNDTKSDSHQPTVEDEENDKTKQVQKAQSQEKPVDKAKYWVTERSIGEFSRTFSFPVQVDQDAVSATFKDGILSITVPKAKKYESRRITVN